MCMYTIEHYVIVCTFKFHHLCYILRVYIMYENVHPTPHPAKRGKKECERANFLVSQATNENWRVFNVNSESCLIPEERKNNLKWEFDVVPGNTTTIFLRVKFCLFYFPSYIHKKFSWSKKNRSCILIELGGESWSGMMLNEKKPSHIQF